MDSLFSNYDTGDFYDEVFEADGKPRPHYARLVERLGGLGTAGFEQRQREADASFMRRGVTFTVYGDEQGTERIFPFDLMPRIIPRREWSRIEAGLHQRLTALNLFLGDLYHGQKILNDGVVPREMIESASHYRPAFCGITVPHNIYIHICGSDLIRDKDGTFYVLEDNARTPSGASYVLENRQAMSRWPTQSAPARWTTRRSMPTCRP